MFFIASIISKWFGVDLQKAQRAVIIAVIVLIGLIVLAVGLWARSCWTAHKLKVSNEQIQKINEANRAERLKELQKVVEDNQTVINTVDNRTVLTDTNVVERNRLIDERVKDADAKIQEAKTQGRDVTQEELEKILTGN